MRFTILTVGALLGLALLSLQACGEDEPTYHCGYVVIPNTVGEGAVAGYPGTFQSYYEIIVEETGSGGFVPFLSGCDQYGSGRGRCFEDEDSFGNELDLRLRDLERNATLTPQRNSIMACRKVKLFTCDGDCPSEIDYRYIETLTLYSGEFGDQTGTCESDILTGPPTCGRAVFE